MAARVRKRAAIADVRALADQLGSPASRRKTDLNEAEFAALQRQVKACCTSPEHHAALDRAWKQYKGEDVPEEETGEQADHAESATSGFRLRGRSCLFTYNSSSFATIVLRRVETAPGGYLLAGHARHDRGHLICRGRAGAGMVAGTAFLGGGHARAWSRAPHL